MREPDSMCREKIRIGGIKLSPELVQVNLEQNQGDQPGVLGFLQLATRKQANLPLIALDQPEPATRGLFLVEAKDFFPVEMDLASDPLWKNGLQTIAPSGTLTVFPHRSSLKILGLTLQILGRAQIPIHGMATSLSALSVNMDYQDLDRAVDLMERNFELPENHSPYRPPPETDLKGMGPSREQILEALALDLRSQIRIYGILEKTGLALVRLAMPRGDAVYWGGELLSLDKGGEFILALSQSGTGDRHYMNLLFDLKKSSEALAMLQKEAGKRADTEWEILAPVEMISFQGPHFGDRYGVAEAAFSLLHQSRLPVLSAGCAGAGICIITQENQARKAAKLLSKKFVVPSSQDAQ